MGPLPPGYLNHVEVRRQAPDRSDYACVVVLAPSGRPLTPARFQQQIAHVPSDQEVALGLVTPHPSCSVGRSRRPPPTLWRFEPRGEPPHGCSGSYRSRHDAVESCAVEAIEGSGVRHLFDVERWHRRQPSDN